MATCIRSCRMHMVIMFLGLIHGIMAGRPGHGRVEQFLMSALRDTTKAKYNQALQVLNRELHRLKMNWDDLSVEQQDLFLAEWLVDGYEEGFGRTEYGFLLSALGKINPRAKFRTAWKVYEVWGSLQPPKQAMAAPPEMITAMMVSAFALNRIELGMVMCLCFSGLLRVGEALHLRWRDVFFSSGVLTLCLGQTKTGLEQKVVINNSLVYAWMARYFALTPYRQHDGLVFTLSYSSVLRWVKKLSVLMGNAETLMTTHSFRRSGASELSRRGLAIADICLFGRWSSDRSAREYIRKGEVAVLRSQATVTETARNTWNRWCQLSAHVWSLHKAISSANLSPSSLDRVTESSFRRLEKAVFEFFHV